MLRYSFGFLFQLRLMKLSMMPTPSPIPFFMLGFVDDRRLRERERIHCYEVMLMDGRLVFWVDKASALGDDITVPK
ncbi:hypothetical protein ACHQM5_024492 [Ranunculus cassubicifolius]